MSIEDVVKLKRVAITAFAIVTISALLSQPARATVRNVSIPINWEIAGAGDFDGDGETDLVLQNKTTLQFQVWFTNGTGGTTARTTPSNSGFFTDGTNTLTIPTGWQICGVGDFNADGKPDILFYKPATGELAVWFFNAPASGTTSPVLSGSDYIWLSDHSAHLLVGTGWQVCGVGDFNADGKTDLVLQNTSTGGLACWEMTTYGTTLPASAYQTTLKSGGGVYFKDVGGSTNLLLPTGYQVANNGVGDFEPTGTANDGKPDLILEDISGDANTGKSQVVYMNGVTKTGSDSLKDSGGTAITVAANWQICAAATFDSSGKSSVVWENLSSTMVQRLLAAWFVDGTPKLSGSPLSAYFDQTPLIDYSINFGTGTGMTLNASSSKVPTVSSNILHVAPSTAYEEGGWASSTWNTTQVDIRNFHTHFQIRIGPGSTGVLGDGMTFAVQNDISDPTHWVGTGGGTLGFAGSPTGACLKFDTYQNINTSPTPSDPSGSCTNIFLGVLASPYGGDDLSSSSITLGNTNPVDVDIWYSQATKTFSVYMQDTTSTTHTFYKEYNLNTTYYGNTDLVSLVGGNVAYSGFTAANYSHSPPDPLGDHPFSGDILNWAFSRF